LDNERIPYILSNVQTLFGGQQPSEQKQQPQQQQQCLLEKRFERR